MIDCNCAITPKSKDNPLGICKACQARVLRESAGHAPRRELRPLLRMFALKVMPWLLSVNTVYMNWLAGGLDPHAWAWGMWGQVGWTWWICATRTWGFVPMNIALWLVYARNHWTWMHG